jgi:hypothetical protein
MLPVPHVLSPRRDATLAEIESAIARARAARIALAFPLGQAATIADPAALRDLRERCDAAGKQVVVVGGDETLRASAVAAGFVAVTSLDEDVADAPAAELPPIASPEAWEVAEARFAVLQRGSVTRPLALRGDEDDELPVEEPPEYVRRLIAVEGTYARPREDETPAVRRGPRFTRKLEPLDDDEVTRRAAEAHEETITGLIRDTGGLTSPLGWLPPQLPGGRPGTRAP